MSYSLYILVNEGGIVDLILPFGKGSSKLKIITLLLTCSLYAHLLFTFPREVWYRTDVSGCHCIAVQNATDVCKYRVSIIRYRLNWLPLPSETDFLPLHHCVCTYNAKNNYFSHVYNITQLLNVFDLNILMFFSWIDFNIW